MRALIAKHPLVSFFVLAYAGSWLVWAPWWASRSGAGWLPIQLPAGAIALLNTLGLFAGPFAAGLLVTGIVDGRAGLRRLLRRLIQVRAHWSWYALALVAIPIAIGLGYLAMPAEAPGASGVAAGVQLVVMYVVYVLGGPLQEEPGWRGFALPRLQARFQPALAALILGVLWCLWHAPLFLTREWDTPRSNAGDLLAYLVFVVSLSFVLAWLTNAARGSVFLAMLGHDSVNWTLVALLPIALGRAGSSVWPAAAGAAVLAVIALVITRGRLGYRPEDYLASERNGDVARPLSAAA